VVDGDCGPGHVVSDFAGRVAIEKARAAGIGWVGVRNSGHFGAAQLWAMRALEHDMIGMAWTNGPPVMVPWGGRSAGISNNPLAIAVPGGHCAPLVLDSAWSKVAGGKVRLAAKKGEHIPDDWIVDAEGRPSTDPHDLPNGGALLPLGHKGYAMAVMAEALAGVLPGGSILDEMRIWFDIPRDPTRYGHVIAAIQIAAFNDLDGFKGRIDELVAKLKAIEPADDYDEILVPGELEARAAERQRREGILLPTAVVEDLRALARECGLPPELMI
jgi:LDH2 family malate/lactate/ureidoglycolate dehydrogenase